MDFSAQQGLLKEQNQHEKYHGFSVFSMYNGKNFPGAKQRQNIISCFPCWPGPRDPFKKKLYFLKTT